MKTRHWILTIAAMAVACLLLSMAWMHTEDAAFAQIYSEGELLYTLDLRLEQTLTVNSEKGTNVISVKDGKIAVIEADCPDGYCMNRGYCSGGLQIVCLPNRLEIRFAGEQKVDGAVG